MLGLLVHLCNLLDLLVHLCNLLDLLVHLNPDASDTGGGSILKQEKGVAGLISCTWKTSEKSYSIIEKKPILLYTQ